MRMVLNISAVLLCGTLAGLSSLAQSAPLHAAQMATTSPVALSQPSASADVQTRHPVGSVEAHFAAANTTHDGHLTRLQVEQADWPRVAKHFSEIDTDNKGWISAEQIHAFNRSHHKHRVA